MNPPPLENILRMPLYTSHIDNQKSYDTINNDVNWKKKNVCEFIEKHKKKWFLNVKCLRKIWNYW